MYKVALSFIFLPGLLPSAGGDMGVKLGKNSLFPPFCGKEEKERVKTEIGGWGWGWAKNKNREEWIGLKASEEMGSDL